MAHAAEANGVEPFTVVTAFFDIGRGGWKGFERSRNFYLDCFKFWARLRNNLVIYSDAETGAMAMRIREEFGLGDKTKLVVIDDIFAIDRPLYERIVEVMSHPEFTAFRMRPEKPEASMPAYNYLMHLKPYFVTDAINRGLTGNAVAWMDFGFNQNGVYYTRPEEFDFEWRQPLDGKFHLFARLQSDDNRPIFEIARTMSDTFQATVMPAPAEAWHKLWDAFRRNQEHLLACGLADSDQTLLIMAYRENPGMFQVHVMDHFQIQSVRLFGGGHLTVKKQKKHKRIKRQAKELWRKGEYAKGAREYVSYLATKARKELE